MKKSEGAINNELSKHDSVKKHKKPTHLNITINIPINENQGLSDDFVKSLERKVLSISNNTSNKKKKKNKKKRSNLNIENIVMPRPIKEEFNEQHDEDDDGNPNVNTSIKQSSSMLEYGGGSSQSKNNGEKHENKFRNIEDVGTYVSFIGDLNNDENMKYNSKIINENSFSLNTFFNAIDEKLSNHFYVKDEQVSNQYIHDTSTENQEVAKFSDCNILKTSKIGELNENESNCELSSKTAKQNYKHFKVKHAKNDEDNRYNKMKKKTKSDKIDFKETSEQKNEMVTDKDMLSENVFITTVDNSIRYLKQKNENCNLDNDTSNKTNPEELNDKSSNCEKFSREIKHTKHSKVKHAKDSEDMKSHKTKYGKISDFIETSEPKNEAVTDKIISNKIFKEQVTEETINDSNCNLKQKNEHHSLDKSYGKESSSKCFKLEVINVSEHDASKGTNPEVLNDKSPDSEKLFPKLTKPGYKHSKFKHVEDGEDNKFNKTKRKIESEKITDFTETSEQKNKAVKDKIVSSKMFEEQAAEEIIDDSSCKLKQKNLHGDLDESCGKVSSSKCFKLEVTNVSEYNVSKEVNLEELNDSSSNCKKLSSKIKHTYKHSKVKHVKDGADVRFHKTKRKIESEKTPDFIEISEQKNELVTDKIVSSKMLKQQATEETADNSSYNLKQKIEHCSLDKNYGKEFSSKCSKLEVSNVSEHNTSKETYPEELNDKSSNCAKLSPKITKHAYKHSKVKHPKDDGEIENEKTSDFTETSEQKDEAFTNKTTSSKIFEEKIVEENTLITTIEGSSCNLIQRNEHCDLNKNNEKEFLSKCSEQQKNDKIKEIVKKNKKRKRKEQELSDNESLEKLKKLKVSDEKLLNNEINPLKSNSSETNPEEKDKNKKSKIGTYNIKQYFCADKFDNSSVNNITYNNKENNNVVSQKHKKGGENELQKLQEIQGLVSEKDEEEIAKEQTVTSNCATSIRTDAVQNTVIEETMKNVKENTKLDKFLSPHFTEISKSKSILNKKPKQMMSNIYYSDIHTDSNELEKFVSDICENVFKDIISDDNMQKNAIQVVKTKITDKNLDTNENNKSKTKRNSKMKTNKGEKQTKTKMETKFLKSDDSDDENNKSKTKKNSKIKTNKGENQAKAKMETKLLKSDDSSDDNVKDFDNVMDFVKTYVGMTGKQIPKEIKLKKINNSNLKYMNVSTPKKRKSVNLDSTDSYSSDSSISDYANQFNKSYQCENGKKERIFGNKGNDNFKSKHENAKKDKNKIKSSNEKKLLDVDSSDSSSSGNTRQFNKIYQRKNDKKEQVYGDKYKNCSNSKGNKSILDFFHNTKSKHKHGENNKDNEDLNATIAKEKDKILEENERTLDSKAINVKNKKEEICGYKNKNNDHLNYTNNITSPNKKKHLDLGFAGSCSSDYSVNYNPKQFNKNNQHKNNKKEQIYEDKKNISSKDKYEVVKNDKNNGCVNYKNKITSSKKKLDIASSDGYSRDSSVDAMRQFNKNDCDLKRNKSNGILNLLGKSKNKHVKVIDKEKDETLEEELKYLDSTTTSNNDSSVISTETDKILEALKNLDSTTTSNNDSSVTDKVKDKTLKEELKSLDCTTTSNNNSSVIDKEKGKTLEEELKSLDSTTTSNNDSSVTDKKKNKTSEEELKNLDSTATSNNDSSVRVYAEQFLKNKRDSNDNKKKETCKTGKIKRVSFQMKSDDDSSKLHQNEDNDEILSSVSMKNSKGKKSKRDASMCNSMKQTKLDNFDVKQNDGLKKKNKQNCQIENCSKNALNESTDERDEDRDKPESDQRLNDVVETLQNHSINKHLDNKTDKNRSSKELILDYFDKVFSERFENRSSISSKGKSKSAQESDISSGVNRLGISDFETDKDSDDEETKSKMLEIISHAEEELLNVMEENEQLTNLKVVISWDVPLSHRIETRVSSCPTKAQQKLFDDMNLLIKRGPFTRVEDETIKENFKKFCSVHELKFDPIPFLNLRYGKISMLPKKERIKFARFLGRGMENRRLYCVYQRFKTLYSSYRKGRFTPTEDAIILQYVKTMNDSNKKFSSLSKILQRPRYGIEKRYRLLQKDSLKLKPKDYPKLVKCLILVTNSDKFEDLKNKNITDKQWADVSKTLNIHKNDLKIYWTASLYTKLFHEGPIDMDDIMRKLIKRLDDAEEDDYRKLNWTKLAEPFKDITRVFLYRIFKKTRNSQVPQELHPSLRKCVIFLKNLYAENDAVMGDIQNIVLRL